MTIKKAVIPAAGWGTRFLPVTKAQPKEMLPIVDTPTIQFVVEEAVSAGIKDIIIITGKGKRAIEDHFDRNFELEFYLKQKGKTEELNQVVRLANLADIHFIRQKELKGLGDAIYCAKKHIGNEPFIVLLGDSLIKSKTNVTRQLINTYNKYKSTIIGVEEVPKERVSNYGIIKGNKVDDSVIEVEDLIEKPSVEEAPSNLAIAARYVLTPEIFDFIEKTPKGKGGEVQITDAIKLLKDKHKVYAYKFDGKRYDIGNRLEYVKTMVEFALNRKDIGKDFKQFLLNLMKGGLN